ncbi:unnamed protein product, partial [Heterosigma akashiwo]
RINFDSDSDRPHLPAHLTNREETSRHRTRMAEEQAPGIPGIGVSETGPTPNPTSETSDLKRKLESGENGEPEPKKSQIADANGVSVASGAPPGPQMP